MRKFRCLIVDDEDLILQRLEQIFQEFSDRFELIGKAYSGQEAMEIALAHKPDIILTDIVMPAIDGIEMIESLKSKLPRTTFIILTAYSDFEYAKRAIKQNVLDYLIKVPLSPLDIRAALERAADEICMLEAKDEEWLKVNRSRLENVYRVRKQIFQEYLRGEVNQSQIERMSDDMKLDSTLGPYSCIVMEICEYEQFEQLYEAKDQNVLKYAMINVLEETLRQYGSGFGFEISEITMMGIITWPQSNSQAEHEARSNELANAILYNMKTYLKRNVNIACSPMFHGWPSLIEAYRTMWEKLRVTYYLKDGAVLAPSYRVHSGEDSYSVIQEQFRTLLQFQTSQGAIEKVNDGLNRIREMARDGSVPRERMESSIRLFLQEVEARFPHSSRANPSERMKGLKFEEQLDLCRSHLKDCLLTEQSPIRSEVTKAKRYIEENLSRKVPLEEVAEFVSLTPPYFSSLFKKELGENFIDYINRRRIEKAVELLKEKDYTNSQLSDALGINNEKYFCTLFKQHFGVSPQKFRKQFFKQ